MTGRPGPRHADRTSNEAAPTRPPVAEPSCSLCGDVAEPLTVRGIDPTTGIATAAAGGGCERAVALDLVENVAVGDTILVHQGFAIARLGDVERA